jgi:hypothetical protein
MSDVTTTTRIDTVSLAVRLESGNDDVFEAERYIYGHHSTRCSFQESADLGCCICNRVEFDLSRKGHSRLLDEERHLGTAYFSTFTVRVYGERIHITVMVGGQE